LGLKVKDPLDQLAIERVTEFQFGLSVAAWVSLASVAAWATHGRWNRLAAFGLILGLGTSLDIAQWDRILLSESVSSSLFVALVGGWILGIRLWKHQTGGPGWPWRIIFIACISLLLVFFTFTRDTNGYLVLAASILLAGSLCAPAVRTRPVAPVAAVLAIVMAGTFYLQDRSADLGKRWLGPFLNVFSARILRVEEHIEFFAERGMPVETLTQEMYLGRSVFFSQLYEYNNGQRLLEWFEDHGRGVYLQFLASRPIQTLEQPLLRAGPMVSPDSSEYRSQEIPNPDWAVLISSVFFPRGMKIMFGLILLPSIVVLSSMRGAATQALWPVAFALVVLAYPLALVVWHGDAIELERHSYQLALQLRLAAWLLVISALSSLGEIAPKLSRRTLDHPVLEAE
jgi:MFS family permease